MAEQRLAKNQSAQEKHNDFLLFLKVRALVLVGETASSTGEGVGGSYVDAWMFEDR